MKHASYFTISRRNLTQPNFLPPNVGVLLLLSEHSYLVLYAWPPMCTALFDFKTKMGWVLHAGNLKTICAGCSNAGHGISLLLKLTGEMSCT